MQITTYLRPLRRDCSRSRLRRCRSARSAAGHAVIGPRRRTQARRCWPAKTVQTHAGSITKGGTPAGACPATQRRRSARRRHPPQLERQLLAPASASRSPRSWARPTCSAHGTTGASGSTTSYAPAGICELKLHRGEQLLFAAVPGKQAPCIRSASSAPGQATVGHAFKVKVIWYNAKGKAKPLAGVQVRRRRPTNSARHRHGHRAPPRQAAA